MRWKQSQEEIHNIRHKLYLTYFVFFFVFFFWEEYLTYFVSNDKWESNPIYIKWRRNKIFDKIIERTIQNNFKKYSNFNVIYNEDALISFIIVIILESYGSIIAC